MERSVDEKNLHGRNTLEILFCTICRNCSEDKNIPGCEFKYSLSPKPELEFLNSLWGLRTEEE
jgi:hypothetical protein